MESALQNYVNRLSAPNPEFTYDEVADWAEDEFQDLRDAGLLVETSPAKVVRCDACAELHWEPVHWSKNGKVAFIACPGAIPVQVDLERLRQWRADVSRFAAVVATALSLERSVRPLGSRVWFLGNRRVARSTAYYFCAAIAPALLTETVTIIRREYPRVNGLLLVPFTPEDYKYGNLKLVDLRPVLTLEHGRVTADPQLLDSQFGGHDTQQPNSLPATSSLKAHRRTLIRAAMTKREYTFVSQFAGFLGVSETALSAIVRGDTRKYSAHTLTSVLDKIGCSRASWNTVPKRIKKE